MRYAVCGMQYSGNCRGSRDGLQVASAQGAQAAFESARRGLATADGAVTRCLCRMFRGDSDQWPGGALQAFWKQHVGCAGAPGDWEVRGGREDISTVERLEKRSLGVVGVRPGANTRPVNG